MGYIHKLYINIINKINTGTERNLKAKKAIIRMFLNKGISIILSMLYVPLFLACLDNTRYGIWITIMSIVNWIGFFDIGIGQGMRNLLTISLAQKDMLTAKKIVSTGYVSITLIFIVICSIIYATSFFYDFHKLVNAPETMAREIDLLILVAAISMCVNFILGIFKSVAFAYQKPQITSNISLYTQATSLLIIYLFYLNGKINSLIFIGTILLATPIIVLTLYSLYYFKTEFKEVRPNIKYFDKQIVKKITLLGGLFFFIQITNLIIFQSNNLIISHVISPDAVSEYYIINKYFTLLTFAFSIITTPFWSAATDAYTKNDFKWIHSAQKKLFKVFIFFIIATIFLYCFAPIFFTIWLGGNFPYDKMLAMIIAIYLLTQMYMNIYLSFINGIGKIKLQLIVTSISATIYIPLSVLFGHILSTFGVILAGIIITIPASIIYRIQFKKLISNSNKTSKKGIWYE